jgi:hypothetical protein
MGPLKFERREHSYSNDRNNSNDDSDSGDSSDSYESSVRCDVRSFLHRTSGV